MPGLDDFTSQLARKLAEAEEVRAQQTRTIDTEMQRRERLSTRFEEWAEELQRSVLRPRIDALARSFHDATVEHFRAGYGFRSQCAFARTDRFPARVTLRLGIDLDPQGSAVELSYAVEIIPMLMEYERRDQLTMTLDELQGEHATAWIERKLLLFLDTYLQLAQHPHYQRENVRVDPVCGMQVSAAYAEERATWEGKSYVFCCAQCRERFVQDPARFLRPGRATQGGVKSGVRRTSTGAGSQPV